MTLAPGNLALFMLPVRDPIWMTGPSAELALRVVLDGYRPPPPVFAAVRSATLGGRDLPAPISSSIQIVAGDLEGHLVLPFTADLAAALVDDALPSIGPARLTLTSGTTVTARLCVPSASSTPPEIHPGECSESFSLVDWEVSDGTPKVWAGTIPQNIMADVQGNLLVHEGRRGSSTTNLLLHGSYWWSVIEIDQGAVVIIDTRGQPLDMGLLTSDFFALQLTLGRRLKLPWLAGLDESGTPVSWRGFARLGREFATRRVPPEPPVPVRATASVTHWAPVFFSAVARALTNEQAVPSCVVHGAYLDSLDESLDSAYLKLQVALEAICNGVKRPGGVLVSDPKAWMRWVEEHRGDIAGHALTEECVEKLIAKVRSAQHAPSTDTVEDALSVLGITPPAEVMAEVRLRSQSVHRFLMNRKEGERDLHADWERVRKIRCVLVAVYAKLTGYSGPIYGWERDTWGHSICAPWWPQTVSDSPGWFAYGRPGSQGHAP